MEQTNQTIAQVAAPATLIPALAAILFGVFLVLGIGFAHSNTIHSAAHDSRHALAFPCH
ncbi:MAG: CbtB-domain containing protein [Rhodospirillaceae bacterium]|jgi:cobalt transporter subunit CbtB|nr:CbtB-domain containing protein [Rhodospirillaceae bacterium]